MKIFEAEISTVSLNFFCNSDVAKRKYDCLNDELKSISGIIDFFCNQNEVDELYEKIDTAQNILNEPDRAEYGDFQTNILLAEKVCNLIKSKGIDPEIIIEPTCGKGNFILAAVSKFQSIKQIYGIEIHEPYVWQTKFSILDFFLTNKDKNKPQIKIFNQNIFDFDLKKQIEIKTDNLLILGNPPWVTSSMLSSLNSKNTPQKANFKNHSGIDAITGKGNFDIGEYITLALIDNFSQQKGHLAFLVKNIVIKNILTDQKKATREIGTIEKHVINAKEEFNVSVDASLMFCKIGTESEFICKEFDFYTQEKKQSYGWANDKFVSDITLYQDTKYIDGKSPFVWRQGVKHDASKVMEFERINGHYINNNKVEFEIEPDLVYGLLKSSDLKGRTINQTRKFTIITQQKVGQETKHIKEKHPKTHQYLTKNIDFFTRRKSSIYKGKPLFSIFGIGDYSFKPFKVAISGMYKDTKFSLIKPNAEKAIMLDDTCYFIGFENERFALIAHSLLNRNETQNFIQSICFDDSKRKVTKDLLMRIDLFKVANNIKFEDLKDETQISKNDWKSFLKAIEPKQEPKNLFDLMEENRQHAT